MHHVYLIQILSHYTVRVQVIIRVQVINCVEHRSASADQYFERQLILPRLVGARRAFLWSRLAVCVERLLNFFEGEVFAANTLRVAGDFYCAIFGTPQIETALRII